MELRRQAPGFCIAAHGCLATVVWGREVQVSDLHQLAEIQRELVASFGHCVVLTIIRAWLSITVEEDIRQVSADNLREFATVSRGAAMVVEAGGMRAAFFRSVVAGVQLIARSAVPQKVFTSIDEGVAWLVARPGVDAGTARDGESIVAGAYELADQFGES